MLSYNDPTLPTLTPGKGGGLALGTWLSLVAGVLALGIGGYLYWQTVQVQAANRTLTNSIAETNRQVAQLETYAVQAEAYKKTATDLHLLFDGQKRWPSVLSALEERLYRRMAITTIQIADTGVVTMSGTTPTYDDYAKLYASLTDATAKAWCADVKPVSVAKPVAKAGERPVSTDEIGRAHV